VSVSRLLVRVAVGDGMHGAGFCGAFWIEDALRVEGPFLWECKPMSVYKMDSSPRPFSDCWLWFITFLNIHNSGSKSDPTELFPSIR
jgi:hypothetical protein